ncbi:uncharacterized protein DNG_00962 [Cephalotrichum gorgonifer]|uniref:Pre-mRNA splicing factor n=1 Tax=Cephalotrichum gorgonifer TaxID=2041049 RepID=A0AAE8MS03_9PEZI|nr:uncharacterized protein DNG_00962 [Cephalotrichum gorgonifer]
MTRVSVYAALLVVSIAATVMTITSITLPNWITYSVSTPTNSPLTQHIGLHRSCSNFRDPPCRPYPSEDQCAGEGEEASFCRMWRSAGFLANFAVALHLVMIVVYAVLIGGGKQRREGGWHVLGGLLLGIAVVEFAIIGIVSYLFDNDDQFLIPGWSLDTSWVLCTVSASLSAACAAGLASSYYLLPPEGGYDCLPDPGDADEAS